MKKKMMFSNKSREILLAIMKAMIPKGGAFEVGTEDYDLLPRVEEFAGSLNPAMKLGFPFLLLYIQFSSILHTGKVFTRLPVEKASHFLERFENSRLYFKRTIILALKMITFIPFYDIDDNAALIGYSHLEHIGEEKRF